MKHITWTSTVSESTQRPRSFGRKSDKQIVQTLMAQLRHEILDIGPWQTIQSGVAERSVLRYTRAPNLFTK